jgi:23S rRNA pseudouridine2605 synthase
MAGRAIRRGKTRSTENRSGRNSCIKQTWGFRNGSADAFGTVNSASSSGAHAHAKIGQLDRQATKSQDGRVKRKPANNGGQRSLFRRVGLARALSKLGYCSRSRAAELIAAGRVKWNGKVRRDPETPVRLGKDKIEIDGQTLAATSKIYLALNKPRGVVTTAADEKNRETVYAYLPEGLPWLAPAGRLDKASEGLLLLTNDSEWAARIAAPETHVDKTYHVQIGETGDELLIQKLREGIRAGDGEFLRVKNVRTLRGGERNSWLEIVLDEGKNRHIRRMLEALKIEVLRLVRVAIGPLALGDLAKGATRALKLEEKQALDRAMRNSRG